MNIIDRVIGWFSPQRGYARAAWRDELRNYDAGDGSRLNANWRAVNSSAEQTDRYSRDTVRARARDLERNSDMLNALIGAFGRNIVGGGFTLQAETGDTDLNQQIEKLWAQWCKKRNCDVTGTQSFSQMLRMAVRRKKVDGGMFFVKRYTGDGLLPFKLQTMEVDELDGSTIRAHTKGNRVCGGIEYTPYNKPVGYWFRQYDVDGMFDWVGNTLIRTFWSKLDRPMNRRLIDNILDTGNIWLNGQVAAEHLLGARAEMLESENNLLDLMAGIIHIHIYITPPSPMQECDFTLEYDVNYVQSALG